MRYTNLVTINGKCYYVSTTYNIVDHGWETMVFLVEGEHPDEEDPNTQNLNIDWSDLYQELYGSEEAAWAGHKRIVANLAEYLENQEEK